MFISILAWYVRSRATQSAASGARSPLRTQLPHPALLPAVCNGHVTTEYTLTQKPRPHVNAWQQSLLSHQVLPSWLRVARLRRYRRPVCPKGRHCNRPSLSAGIPTQCSRPPLWAARPIAVGHHCLQVFLSWTKPGELIRWQYQGHQRTRCSTRADCCPAQGTPQLRLPATRVKEIEREEVQLRSPSR